MTERVLSNDREVGLREPIGGAEGYRALVESAGVILREDLVRVRLWGRDPVKMLNGLLTNDLGQLSESRSVRGLLLTPKGRIISDVRVLLVEENDRREVHAVIPSAAKEAVVEHLRKYVPPLFARFEVLDAAIVGVYGPLAGEIAGRLGGGLKAEERGALAWGRVEDERVALLPSDYGGGAGFEALLPPEDSGRVLEAVVAAAMQAGGTPVTPEVLEIRRVEAGVPVAGRELTEEMLPAEAYESTGRLEEVISFSKGCYTGQEVVIRIAHRGHVNRLLRGILLGSAPLPEARTPLRQLDGGKEVGWISSSVASPAMGQNVALAYVRREVEPGSRVRVGGEGGADGQVVALPFLRA